MNEYMKTARLDKDERNMITKKKFAAEDFFPTARKEWEVASMRSSNPWKQKLKAILIDLLEKNNLIDILTDWAKNVVRFKVLHVLTTK